MHSNTQSKKVAAIVRQNEKLKLDLTLSKQGQSTQRIQYEQINTELKNKLNAREMTIQELHGKLKEKDKMLDQFRRLHNSGHGGNSAGNDLVNTSTGSISGGGGGHSSSYHNHHHHHQIPPSTGASNRHRSNNNNNTTANGNHNRHHLSSAGGSTIATASIAGGTGGVEPPLKGLMMQRQAQQIAQQQNFVSSRRGPNMPSSSSASMAMGRNMGMGMGSSQEQHQYPQQQSQHQHQHSMGPPTCPTYTRPYSSNNSVSSNSISSNTPRVRDLSHGTAFNFTGGSSSSGSSGGGGGQRLNKRRRGNNNNHSSTTPGASRAMSPNTAFTLNQGAHTVNRGPRWLQR